MKVFGKIFETAMRWSRHPHAERYLVGVSLVESSVLPLPTVVLLAPMVLANPARAWWLASITTVASVLGGVLGYLIGYFLFEQAGRAIIDFYNAEAEFESVRQWFNQYGVWMVLLAGATPIPYKVFTIASGAFGLPLVLFTLASLVGRAFQFFLVAGLLWWGGARIQRVLEKWMEPVGWGVVALVLVGYFLGRWA